MTNYIADVNRYGLETPPTWWLDKLHEFDPGLVVVPSRQQCVYRLCLRRKLRLPEHIANDVLFNESDTKMLASYSLVPVTSIMAHPNWANPEMFQELERRAPHRNGGAAKVIAAIEAQEAGEDAKRQAVVDDMTTQTAKDGWGMYLKGIGVRSHMYIPKTRNKVDPSIGKAPAIKIASS